jgi:hypothetical protein
VCPHADASIPTCLAVRQQELVYLGAHPKGQPNSLPVSLSPDSLPKSFSFTEDDKSMSDDPWRSMAAFSRKVILCLWMILVFLKIYGR